MLPKIVLTDFGLVFCSYFSSDFVLTDFGKTQESLRLSPVLIKFFIGCVGFVLAFSQNLDLTIVAKARPRQIPQD